MLRAAAACAVALLASPSRAADELDVPAGVRFKPAPAAVNDAARQKLQAAFADPDGKMLASLLDTKFVVCGPGLWQWLKQAPRVATVGKPSDMFVPLDAPPKVDNMQRLEGRTYFDRATARVFLRAFRAGLPVGEQPTVRRPTRLEISLLWATIPFDLDDPLFVVEVGGHHLIVVMTAGGKRIIWIDDLAGMTSPPGKGIVLPPPPPYEARRG
jgi:hypothetical protein